MLINCNTYIKLTAGRRRAAHSHLAVHENVVCAERSVNQTIFVHELQTLEDLIGDLQHLLWATTNKIKPTMGQSGCRVEGDRRNYWFTSSILIYRDTNTVRQGARVSLQENEILHLHRYVIKQHEEENDNKLTWLLFPAFGNHLNCFRSVRQQRSAVLQSSKRRSVFFKNKQNKLNINVTLMCCKNNPNIMVFSRGWNTLKRHLRILCNKIMYFQKTDPSILVILLCF